MSSERKPWMVDHFGQSLAAKFPECAKMWDYGRNPKSVTPGNVRPYTTEKFLWTRGTTRWRSVRSVVCSRKLVADKPKEMSGKSKGQAEIEKLLKVSSLAIVHPELAKEWDFEKNIGLTPADVLDRSGKKVWWICAEGHSWQATIANRVGRKSGCPQCFRDSQKLWKKNPTLFAQLAQEQPMANFDPWKVTAKSAKMYFWNCEECGEVFEASVKARVAGKTCKCCAKPALFPVNKSLGYLRPDLVKEWDTEKNGDLTPWQVRGSAQLKVWWKCSEHPEDPSWQASIHNRCYNGTGCPVCKSGNRHMGLRAQRQKAS